MGNCMSAKTKKEYVGSRADVNNLKALYNIDMKVLGAGSFGKVFLAQNKSDPAMEIAIKVIKKAGLDEEDLEALHREVQIMQLVDHPNIIKYLETYDDAKYIYLCMELCRGGELFAKVTESGKPMKEKEVA